MYLLVSVTYELALVIIQYTLDTLCVLSNEVLTGLQPKNSVLQGFLK